MTDQLTTTEPLSFDGTLLHPGDPGWDDARRAWQLRADQHPAAIVRAGSVRDVITTVRRAAELGLRVAPQATGHNAGPLGPLDGTALLRTGDLRDVTIDPQRRIARVGAGALWGDVTVAAAEHGLAALAGSSRDVGVVGYTLGGGVSWLGRAHGPAAGQVTAAEIVTADGELLRVDDEHHPDLFWAIRGGGGSFGVVTALEFRLFPITEVQAGALFWPIERAAEVLHAWREWADEVPDTVTSVGRLLRFPPLPEIPEPVRGRSLVAIELASLEGPVATELLLRRLRALGPEMDTVHSQSPVDLADLHMDPPTPVPGIGDGTGLAAFPVESLDALLATVGPGSTLPPLLSVEIRQLGGALARPVGAVSGLDAAVVVFAVTIAPDDGAAAAATTTLDALASALAPWAAESTYLNFVERAGTRTFPAATLRRLRSVKTTYDPADRIRANHPVAPFGPAGS
ncbi:FAD-binding oxidoreductase [Pseudonocardia kongjuensis]|uniref:FAD-binding oxidoreductase n=1 Tax=Pseudonocardia kongjuensis TaxID=102227 RepID=A0ABN1XNX4_9PSEU